jgi:hypothetical protein
MPLNHAEAITMRSDTPMHILSASFLIVGVCGIGALRLMFSRTREFGAQAKHRFAGWDYRTITNGVAASYSLRHYAQRRYRV